MRLISTKNIRGIDGYKTEIFRQTRYADIPCVSFEVPSNWVFRWSRIPGSFSVYGPAETSIHFSIGVPFSKNPKMATSDRVLEVKQSGKKEFTIVSDQRIDFLGEKARETVFSYMAGTGEKMESSLLLFYSERGTVHLYFNSAESDFNKYLEAYDRLKSSFRFLE